MPLPPCQQTMPMWRSSIRPLPFFAPSLKRGVHSHQQTTFLSWATLLNKRITPHWLQRNYQWIAAGVKPTNATVSLSCGMTTITSHIYSRSLPFFFYWSCSMLTIEIWGAQSVHRTPKMSTYSYAICRSLTCHISACYLWVTVAGTYVSRTMPNH